MLTFTEQAYLYGTGHTFTFGGPVGRLRAKDLCRVTGSEACAGVKVGNCRRKEKCCVNCKRLYAARQIEAGLTGLFCHPDLLASPELVPDPGDRNNELGPFRIGLQLSTKARHVHIDRTSERIVAITP